VPDFLDSNRSSPSDFTSDKKNKNLHPLDYRLHKKNQETLNHQVDRQVKSGVDENRSKKLGGNESEARRLYLERKRERKL
jgi:hypothetical protein